MQKLITTLKEEFFAYKLMFKFGFKIKYKVLKFEFPGSPVLLTKQTAAAGPITSDFDD